jgi:RNA-directed DNA polymerase
LRLEEQARRRGLSEEAVRQRVQQYETRWTSWAERQMKAALLVYCS